MNLLSRAAALFFGTVVAQLLGIYIISYLSVVDFISLLKLIPVFRSAFLCTVFSLMLPGVILSISKGIWEESSSIIIFILTSFIACISIIAYPPNEIDGTLQNLGISSSIYIFIFIIAWPVQGLLNAYHVNLLTQKQTSNNSSQPTTYGGG